MANTFTTVLGYMATRVRQRLGVEGKLESLSDIFNFIQLDDRVATSGQPTEAQFSLDLLRGQQRNAFAFKQVSDGLPLPTFERLLVH